jgi:hypothetical protein
MAIHDGLGRARLLSDATRPGSSQALLDEHLAGRRQQQLPALRAGDPPFGIYLIGADNHIAIVLTLVRRRHRNQGRVSALAWPLRRRYTAILISDAVKNRSRGGSGA